MQIPYKPVKSFTLQIRLLVLILFSIQGLGVDAQYNLDSLYAIWQDPSRADSTRIAAYYRYIWNGFLFSNPDTAAVLAEALHTYAERNNYPEAAAEGYLFQGNVYYLQGNFPAAIDKYEKSVVIFEEIGDTKGIGAILANIGSIYFSKGNDSRALEYYQKAIAIFEKNKDNKGLSPVLANIGLIYSNQNNTERALEYYQKALEIDKEHGRKKGIAYNLHNIGSLYDYQDQYTLSLEYYLKSYALLEELNDKPGMAMSLNNIGVIYMNQGDYPGALESFEKSMKYFEETGDKKGTALNLCNMGVLYRKQGHTTRAIAYCKEGLMLSEEIGALSEQKENCQCLYDTYKEAGKGSEALIYLEKMRVVEDSLNARETIRKLEQMEFSREMLQDSIAKADEARRVEEAHREEVRKKNQTRNILMVSTLLFLLLTGGLYSRWRYVRKSNAIITKEKDRSENLLLNILPAEIAAELKEKGRAEARDFEMVSILFTDFKGFTEQSAKLSAAALVNEINHCFEAFDGIMEKYGIEKIKTIGDAYMAAGGLPVPDRDSAKKTVLAALEMQAFIQKRKIVNEAANIPAFEMRLGIHTGPVVAGIVGVKKFQYDIWGDTVNTASRMESSGAVGKVNISHATYELIKTLPEFDFESRGKIEAKGKGEMEMYFVQLSVNESL